MPIFRATTRRDLDHPPPLVGRSPHDYHTELWDWLDKALMMMKGLPAGFNGLVPLPLVVGGTGSTGTAAAGWMAADAIAPLPAAAPAALLFFQTSGAGSSASTVHADFSQDTIILAAQARNMISMRV